MSFGGGQGGEWADLAMDAALLAVAGDFQIYKQSRRVAQNARSALQDQRQKSKSFPSSLRNENIAQKTRE